MAVQGYLLSSLLLPRACVTGPMRRREWALPGSSCGRIGVEGKEKKHEPLSAIGMDGPKPPTSPSYVVASSLLSHCFVYSCGRVYQATTGNFL